MLRQLLLLACLAAPSSASPGLPDVSGFTGVARVSLKGKETLLRASGLANKMLGTAMPADALFRIGSNSKLFVTVALYQLQEQGILNVTDLVSSHLHPADFVRFSLPNMTAWCPRVLGKETGPCTSPTIEQLLSMGSGLVDVTNCEYPAGSAFLKYCWRVPGQEPTRMGLQLIDGLYSGNLAALIGGFLENPLASSPGAVYHYTNINFMLASYLVEKYTEMSLGEYLDRKVLGPLGLKNTHLDNIGPAYSVRKYKNLPNEYIEYYDSKTGAYIDAGAAPLELSPGAYSGAGGMFSTTSDMITWYRTLISEQPVVLSVESVKAILRPRMPVGDGVTSYAQGVGVRIRNYNKTTGWPGIVEYEGGTLNCFTSIIYATRPVDVAVTAFSTVRRLDLTSNADYNALLNQTTDFLVNIKRIVVGADDGGAGALANALFNEYAAQVPK